ncbi:MAG: tetratricopeptide repeat protein [Candidatus Helarchaeota archaeon]
MPLLGEPFGLSLEITDGKLVSLQDGIFKKQVILGETFTSVRRVELTNEVFTSTFVDQTDPLLSSSNKSIALSTGIQKKVFSQNLEMGVRKIELLQGIELGQAIIRCSYNLERGMKWQIKIPFELSTDSENLIHLPQEIDVTIQTNVALKFDDDALIFSIPEGFTQIIFFIKSQIPYERTPKNLLLITKGDQSKQAILNVGGDQKFFPVVTFVYLQDFKSKITRSEDLYQIGRVLAQRKQNIEAIKYLKKALETIRSLGDQLKEAEILLALGTAEYDAGDYEAAAKNFNYALKITEEYQNEALRTGCLLSLSKCLKKLNRYQDALDNQYIILEETRARLDHLGEAEILVDISDSLMGLGQLDEAVQYQQAAIDLRHRMNDSIGEANNLMNFGSLLMKLGKTGESMGCYEQALRIKRNLMDDKGVGDCLKSMALSFQNLGKYEKAREYYEKAKQTYQNIALMLEVQDIDQKLDKMKERPYPECEICTYKCTPNLVGAARKDITDPTFINRFKQILRESLAQKNMDKLVDMLLETAVLNLDVKSKGISNETYALCLLVQSSNIHLAQLNPAQKKQILTIVQGILRKRKYNAL